MMGLSNGKGIEMNKFLKLIGCGLFMFLSACATEQTRDGLSAEELYLKGYDYFQETDYERAIEYFDEIEIFSGTHYKSAFQQRNRDMVNRSRLAIFAVNKTEGGAYSTMKYAAAQGVEMINLYDIMEEEK